MSGFDLMYLTLIWKGENTICRNDGTMWQEDGNSLPIMKPVWRYCCYYYSICGRNAIWSRACVELERAWAMMHHRSQTFQLWHNVASRWTWVTDNEGGAQIVLLLSPYLSCVSARQRYNLGQCIGHDTPEASHIQVVGTIWQEDAHGLPIMKLVWSKFRNWTPILQFMRLYVNTVSTVCKCQTKT